MHRKIMLFGLAGAFLALTAYSGLSAVEAEDIIKYRRNVMKAIGGHMGASASIIRGKVKYDSDLLDHAKAIEAMSKDIPGLFPADSDIGVTAAKEEVWTKRKEFEKASFDSKKAASAFVKAVQSRNKAKMQAAFQDLGASCKACHKDFRVKDE